jgi:hypothetical protein
MCLPQTHQAATDFLFYAFSIFLVLFIHNNAKRGLWIVALLGVLSSVGRFYIVYSRQLVIYIFNGVE